MFKKSLITLLLVSLSLSACTKNITGEYDKTSQKAYQMGLALGLSEGSFDRLTLAQDDVSYSTDKQDYTEALAALEAYNQALEKFGGKTSLRGNIALGKILLQKNGKTTDIKDNYKGLAKSTQKLVPERSRWYFGFGYVIAFHSELVKRFKNEDGTFRTPGQDFVLTGLHDLNNNVSSELSLSDKRALNKLLAYEEKPLTAENIQEINDLLQNLLKSLPLNQ